MKEDNKSQEQTVRESDIKMIISIYAQLPKEDRFLWMRDGNTLLLSKMNKEKEKERQHS